MRRPEQELVHRPLVQHLKHRATPGLFWWHTPSGAYYGRGRSAHIQGAIMVSLGARRGIPDILLLHLGRLYGIELKHGKGRTSEAQGDTMRALVDAGAECTVAHSLDEAVHWLEERGLLVGRMR